METKDVKILYACETKCRFLFESEVEPERCPDCGKKKIRLANACEIVEEDYGDEYDEYDVA